jgi:hypothetical protein
MVRLQEDIETISKKGKGLKGEQKAEWKKWIDYEKDCGFEGEFGRIRCSYLSSRWQGD